MELNLDGLPNSVIHVSGFDGEDGGIMELIMQCVHLFSVGQNVWHNGSHLGIDCNG
jgi:hypothetical protein